MSRGALSPIFFDDGFANNQSGNVLYFPKYNSTQRVGQTCSLLRDVNKREYVDKKFGSELQKVLLCWLSLWFYFLIN